MAMRGAIFVLAAGFLALLFNGGSRFTMGLMLKPMADDLDWARTTLSLAVTFFMIVSALALPVAGRLVDRFNTWTVLATAMLAAGASIALMRFIETPLEMLVLYGVVFALASAGTSITPIGVLLSRWFPHRLGLANGVAISGMGLGQLLIILVLTGQLEAIGWRGSFLWLGLAGMILAVPLAVFAIAPATRAHGTRGVPPSATMDRPQRPLGSRRFWLLLAVYAICGLQDFFVATHVVAFARDQGVDGILAGNLYAFMGLTGLIGVLAAGHLSDRRGPVLPTAICFVIRIVVFAAIPVFDGTAGIAAFALLYGLTFWITAPLTVVFVRQYFGIANLGAITGVVTMVHHGAGGLGALAGGLAFDIEGHYTTMFLAMLVLSALALWLTLRLTPAGINPRP